MPDTHPVAGDPGPCPGPEFTLIRWLKPVADEPPDSIEWCERRRAAGLAKAGHVEVKPDDEA